MNKVLDTLKELPKFFSSAARAEARATAQAAKAQADAAAEMQRLISDRDICAKLDRDHKHLEAIRKSVGDFKEFYSEEKVRARLQKALEDCMGRTVGGMERTGLFLDDVQDQLLISQTREALIAAAEAYLEKREGMVAEFIEENKDALNRLGAAV